MQEPAHKLHVVVAPMPFARLSRRIAGLFIYLALAGLGFAVNYPGRLNPDSIDQLTQAVHPVMLNDWHEPWTIFYWRLFSPLLGEPAGALLFQSLILFVYPSMLLSRAFARGERSAAVWIILGLFTVSLIEVSGQIVKDALLTGFILCFLAALESPVRGRWKILLGVPPVIAASLVRPVNAFLFGFAAVPALLAFRVRWRSALPAVLLVLSVCAGQVRLVKILDQNVLGAIPGNAESSLMIFDVAGISAISHDDLFATIPGWPTKTLARPWDCYKSYYWDPFQWGKCGRYFDLFNEHVPNRYAFWIHAILSHPGAWLLHRARYFFQCLVSVAPVAIQTPDAVNSTRSGLFSLDTYWIDMRDQFQLWQPGIAFRIVQWIAALVFSRPAGLAEMAACLAAVWAGLHKRREDIDTVGLAAGGIGLANILVMALFGVAAVGRYFLPAYVCGLLILVRAVMRDRRPPQSVAA